MHLEGLKERTPSHMYVAGVHGTGKTSYLVRLVHIAGEHGMIGVLSNLDEASPRDNISSIMRAIVDGVNQKLKSKTGAAEILRDWDRGSDSSMFQHPKIDRLSSDQMRQDFEVVKKLLDELGVAGVVICIDEAQRVQPAALSALKNALQHLDCFLVVLSLRLVVDTGNAIAAGRALLDEKAREAEGDIGASRFFITGIPMGAFQSEAEAAACIQRRLEGNVVQFDAPVAHRIARIAGFLPREVINVASQIYSYADSEGVRKVDVSVLDSAFKEVFRTQFREAVTLCSNISAGARSALTGLLAQRCACGPDVIAHHLYPSAAPEVLTAASAGISGELQRIAEAGVYIQRVDEKFDIVDPVRAYALQLALGAEES